MADLEIPVGKRTPGYRFLEMLPALLSYGAIVLLIILSLVSPAIAAGYLLVIIVSMLVKVVAVSYHMVRGRQLMDQACQVDWRRRLDDLEQPKASLTCAHNDDQRLFGHKAHLANLERLAENPSAHPRPSELYNAIIMPAYNEELEVIEPSVQSLLDTTYDKQRLIVVFAYEQRGGEGIKKTADILKDRYGDKFHSFHTVEHPKDIPNEVVGKGGNITYAGRYLQRYLDEQGISYDKVIVTSMDCDNKPHATYFDYVTYEYIVQDDREKLSYQPVALFTNNIWDVPAPMRVLATGNSFWNVISSMRPHALRNFASHAQPMSALVAMDFWSVRTIVEDGHQYWRSFFHFGGDYRVVPIRVPIYQDAVLSQTYTKTLKAQFIQLRRWSYGSSDIAYVGSRVFSRQPGVPRWSGVTHFIRLLDGHVSLACVPILIMFGGWAPLLLNGEAARSVAAHQLPDMISTLQQIGMLGLAVSIFSSFKLLPPRPERYTRRRNIWMLLQWVLMPITTIGYGSMAAYNAQTHLLLGKYLDKFDVTEKTTVAMNDQAKVKSGRKRSKVDQGDELPS